jgi:formylglycine-generating enzyme required for sulfatase activity
MKNPYIEEGYVLRGGSWFNGNDFNLRLAYRVWINPDFKSYTFGFRCVSPCARVNRGGSWYGFIDNLLRSAYRLYYNHPGNRINNNGFRCTGRKATNHEERS